MLSVCCLFSFPARMWMQPFTLNLCLSSCPELQWTPARQRGCCCNTTAKGRGANLSSFTLDAENTNHRFFQGVFYHSHFCCCKWLRTLRCADNGDFVLAANQKNVGSVKTKRLFWMKQIFFKDFSFSFPKQNSKDVVPLGKKICHLSTRKHFVLEASEEKYWKYWV